MFANSLCVVLHKKYHVYDLSDNGNGIDHTNGTNGHGEQGEQRKFPSSS